MEGQRPRSKNDRSIIGNRGCTPQDRAVICVREKQRVASYSHAYQCPLIGFEGTGKYCQFYPICSS